MELIIIAFHIALVIGILLMVVAVREKKKLKALEASQNQETQSNSTRTISTSASTSTSTTSTSASTTATTSASAQSEPVNEQKQAVQLVHDGLEHVVNHLSQDGLEHVVDKLEHTEGSKSDLSLAEINAQANSKAGTTVEGATATNTEPLDSNGKVCPKCDAPRDNSFDFCLKCSHA